MSRWRSFLPDLMTVRAVMVRAAMEKKKSTKSDSGHSQALTSKRWQGKKSGAVVPAGLYAAKP